MANSLAGPAGAAMTPHVRFNHAQTPFGRVGPTGAANLLPQSIHLGSQRLTLALGMAAEQQSQSAAAGAAHLLLYAIELAFQAGATGAGFHLPKLAGFMLELPAYARIRLDRTRGDDNGRECPDRGRKNRVLLHVLRSPLLKPPWRLAKSTQVRRNGSKRT